CAKLEHPNILKIFELGKVEESGRLYCVMQYIDGGSLTELIKNKGVLSEAEVLAISRGVLSGLQCAHKAGIIHRDIKPDNILFDRNGFPIIADFGIAQNLNNVFTLNKQIIGTPEYMSPEQAQGLDLNSRTDIYSFGVVMFQMATGRLPFCAETPLELALKHVNDTAPSPLAINRSMNPELAKIIIKAMKKDRTQRYADAKAVLADLAALERAGNIFPDANAEAAYGSETPPIQTEVKIKSPSGAAKKSETNDFKKSGMAVKMPFGKAPSGAALASTECPRCGLSKKFGMPYCLNCIEEINEQEKNLSDEIERDTESQNSTISGTFIDDTSKRSNGPLTANSDAAPLSFILKSPDNSIKIEVHDGDIIGRCCKCKSDEEKRSAGCDKMTGGRDFIDCIRFNSVSRKHIRFSVENGQLFVTALPESKNITAINGFELEKEARYKIKEGDKIQLSSKLIFILSIKN
ncbi:MAG TPA: FHA domain-containing serine/threonine-protein kinase, partial [Candidatus Wallbacteria bacterium]|nr:FHA domain-containing serine/threonine-protein kinase [Candidatus Wallbacteria bacterium]